MTPLLAASIVVKVTLTTALGLAAAALARRRPAAVRHTLLSATFAVLLVLPAAAILAPPLRIVRTARQAEPVVYTRSVLVPLTPEPAPRGAAPPLRPVDFLAMAWIAGGALFLLPVAAGLWQVRRLRRTAIPWSDGQSTAASLSAEAGIRRPVEILLHDAVPGPMTCGILHPAILLPHDAASWTAENLHRALVHELEHVRRGDWVTHCIARALCAVYWFHPLVWMAWRGLVLDAERSCDDAVLGRSEATAYADQLVDLAQRLTHTSGAKSPLLAMASRTDLSARVTSLLDSQQRRGRAGRRAVVIACTAAVLLVGVLSPLSVAAPQDPVVIDGLAQHFRDTASLAVVDLTATDRNGNSIEGLRATDFVLTEDGTPQNIVFFEFQSVIPEPGAKQRVHDYYILGYHPTNSAADGSFRKIGLTCLLPAVKLDFRAGYYANKAWGKPNGERTPPSVTVPVVRPDSPAGVTPPVLISKSEPEYSLEARKAKHQGTVTLSVLVDASGAPTEIQVVRHLGLGLDEQAVAAVSKWRFSPAQQNGRAIAMRVEVSVDFRLL